ncbi:hypothetical protein BX600DRAFT_441222 [Xylariales sp. PMI_506]|nr:hypothetical protein BX600DRAFT_441222 [Xylariales sp. PMI_506]
MAAAVDWLQTIGVGLGVAISSVFWFLTYIVVLLLKTLYSIGALLASPISYPFYWAFAVVTYLLSPVWIILRTCAAASAWTLQLIAKLKYVYIYLAIAAMIGITFALVAHGTSSTLFLMLGISPSQVQSKSTTKLMTRKSSSGDSYSYGDDEDRVTEEDEDYENNLSSSPTLTGAGLARAIEMQQAAAQSSPITNAMFEEQWRRARSTRLAPIKPSRRFRGLLAQTIHEESSESESL